MTSIKNQITSLIGVCLLSGIMLASGIRSPEPGFLVWTDGAPNLLHGIDGGGRFSPEKTAQRMLAIRTSCFLFEIDVRDARVTRFDAGTEDERQHRPDDRLVESDKGGRFTWEAEGEQFWMTGDQEESYDPEFFPVRIVETGPWFQHVTIHDLKWAGGSPDGLDGEFWLEILAWPDRLLVQLKTRDQSLAKTFATLGTWKGVVGVDPGWNYTSAILEQTLEEQAVYTFATLEWQSVHHNPDGFVTSRDSALKLAHNEIENIDHLVIEPLAPDSDARTRLGTPMRMGLSQDYKIRLSNRSSREALLNFAVQLPEKISMTGHSLMLLDSVGNQTGLPVQISKNWHRKDLNRFLPYMGSWSHGRISLLLPAGFDEDVTLRLIQGDYGPYNASSISQLSLIGWGSNGIWIQAALGSWGETICLQPGRVLRRTMVTDWRPFKTYSMQGKEYGWTANAGGIDTFVYFDKSGDYVPFIENEHLLKSYGPCLAQMQFSEVSRDRKIAVQGTWYLPQTNDFARTYLKIRCDILEDVEFSRFSIIQLGADRYNANLSSLGAVGNTEGLIFQMPFSGEEEGEGYISNPVRLAGNLPWITLAGDSVDPDSRLGQAQRILMVHEWKARIGGKTEPVPTAAFYKHSFHRKDNYSAELIPSMGINRLEKGDFIEMTLEFTLAPLSRKSYYGESEEVERILIEHSNDWAAAEAVASLSNSVLWVDGKQQLSDPLPQFKFTGSDHAFRLSGTMALVPLLITDVPKKGSFQLYQESNPQTITLNQEWRQKGNGEWDVIVMLDPRIATATFILSLKTSKFAKS